MSFSLILRVRICVHKMYIILETYPPKRPLDSASKASCNFAQKPLYAAQDYIPGIRCSRRTPSLSSIKCIILETSPPYNMVSAMVGCSIMECLLRFRVKRYTSSPNSNHNRSHTNSNNNNNNNFNVTAYCALYVRADD